MNTYADDIHKHLRCKERKRFKYRGKSSEIQLRKKMITHLDRICDDKNYCISVQHLAAYLLDIFMDNHKILPGHLEMSLVICIILAAKLEEKDKMPPKFTDFQSYLPRNYKLSEFLQAEIAILSFFEWNIMFPTVPHFAEYYLLFTLLPNDIVKDSPLADFKQIDTCAKKHVQYFLDIVIQDHEYLQFYPSLVGAACIASTRRCLVVRPVWPDTLEAVTLYSYHQIETCVEMLLKALDEDMVKRQIGTSTKSLVASSKRKLSSSESSVTKIVKK